MFAITGNSAAAILKEEEVVSTVLVHGMEGDAFLGLRKERDRLQEEVSKGPSSKIRSLAGDIWADVKELRAGTHPIPTFPLGPTRLHPIPPDPH